MTDLGFNTRAIHAGERRPRGRHIPVVTPIHPTVSFVYESADELDAVLGAEKEGYVYHRYGNPTVAAFEIAVANLEGGEAACAFASGMGAIHTALLAAGVRAATPIVVALDLYGATYTLLTKLLAELGVTCRMVDVTDLEAVATMLSRVRPVALFVETLSNPLLKVADIPALAELAHCHGAQLLVDNTFSSPWLIRPLEHGADMVIHSATKYIGGHGDVMAGVVVAPEETQRRLVELNKLVGSVLGPFEAWLALRGLKTLPLRMRQQCENALAVARWLDQDPRISRVYYPGLPQHPQHSLAQQLFEGKGFGGVLSFEVSGVERAELFNFLEALQVCLPATSLGDIYTLVLHPASASHRSLSPAKRAQVGIGENLLRLSAGIEEAADIIADLEAALDAVQALD